MEKETKKYLIIGTTLVVTVGIAVVLWKKYQTQSAAGAAAADQSNQDELSLLAASLESNAYASQTSSYSPAVVGASTPKSLADEVLALEQALGIAPTSSPVPAPKMPPSGSGNTPVATPASPALPKQTAPEFPAPAHDIPTSEMIRYNHGAPLFAMDGVTGEGVLVS